MDIEYFKTIPKIDDDEIDIQSLKNIFKKNLRNILIITFGIIGSTFIFNQTKGPTWEGEFQIVLLNEENSSSNSLSRFLQSSGGRTFGNIIGLNRGTGISSKLLTEVEILKSPYALMDNFKNFKKRKNSYEKKIYKSSFKDWRDTNLDIFLLENTNVLRIALRDTNRKNILETLNGISLKYQKYSKKTKIDNLNNGAQYLENQINNYQNKLNKSLIEAENYAVARNLTSSQISLIKKSLSSSSFEDGSEVGIKLPPKIESIKLNTTYKIISYEDQIKQIQKINNDPQKIVFLNLDPILLEKASGLQSNIDSLFFAREKYKENDLNIIKLLDTQKLLIKKFKADALTYLNSQIKKELENQEKVDNAPGSLNTYKSLLRVVGRNESILMNLEDRLIILKLEQAKNQNPWKQITQPTLLDKPIAPRKLRNLLLSIIFGLTSSFSIIYLKYKTKGVILSNRFIDKKMKFNKLFQISKANDFNLDNNISIISKDIKSNKNIKNIEVINIGNINYINLNNIIGKLRKFKIESKSIEINDLIDLDDSSYLIILLDLFETKRKEIDYFCNIIDKLNIKVYGYIIVE